MTQDGVKTSVYLRENITEIIDKLVDSDKKTYISRSQFINSVLHKELRMLGKLPKLEEFIW